jgi:8-oxo-dGTP pyrophosphatase MutT (NUDIX family)
VQAVDVSDLFRPDSLFARVRQHLAAAAPAGQAGGDHVLNPDLLLDPAAYRDAAVLVPLVAHPDGVSVLLTQRTSHLAAHAGQIAFPGGKIDAADAGPSAAAMREAAEEVGLPAASVSILGTLDPYLSRTGYRIVPVVARVEPGVALSLNRDEVSEAFEVPLSFLMDPTHHRRVARTFFGRERYFYEMPYEGRYIWGVTAGIVRAFYERVFG